MILEGYKVSKISEKDMMDIISNLGLVYDERFMVINVFRDGVVLETQNLVLDFDGRNLFLYENRQIYEEIKYSKQEDIVDKWNSTLTKKILYHDNIELLRKKI